MKRIAMLFVLLSAVTLAGQGRGGRGGEGQIQGIARRGSLQGSGGCGSRRHLSPTKSATAWWPAGSSISLAATPSA